MTDKLSKYNAIIDEINTLGFNDHLAVIKIARETAQQAKTSGDEAFAIFFEGEALFYEGDVEGSYECEKKAAEMLHNISFVLSNFATVATLRGFFDEAFVNFDEALTLDPQNCHALCCKGVSLSQIGRDDEAMELFNRALQYNDSPYYWQILVNKAILLSHQGLPLDTLDFLDKALEIQPHNVHVLNKKGITLYHLGRDDEAITCYERALSISPDHTDTLRNLGTALCRKNLYKDALTFFKRIPHDILIYDDLACMTAIYDGLGKIEEAVETAKAWVDELDKLELPTEDAENYYQILITKKRKRFNGDF